MAFPPSGNSGHAVVSVSIDFPSYLLWDAPIHHIAYDYSPADWDSLHDYLRDVPWEDIFKLSASTGAREFCESVWLELMYIYLSSKVSGQASHISMVLSCLCYCHSSYKSLFCMCQKDISFEYKVKSRQASNCCKRVFEAAKLAYTDKTKESITSQKLGSWDFW